MFIDKLKAFTELRESKIRGVYKKQADTGRLAESVESEIIKLPNGGYVIKWVALDYSYFVEHGRGTTIEKTNKQHPTGFDLAIKEWVRRHIPYKNEKDLKNIAFLVGRKIHREGIKVPNKYNPGYQIKDIFLKFPHEISDLMEDLADDHVKNIQTILFNPKQWQ